MSTRAKPVALGILGGTFDPVHWGHLRAALAVREALQLDTLYLVPARDPPHRGEPAAAAEHRLAMLREAIGNTRGLAVDERELRRGGKSYSFDTLTEIRRDHPAAVLFFILGTDALHGLPSWHRWQELTDLAHLVVINRPGEALAPGKALAEWLAPRLAATRAELGDALAGRVLSLCIPPNAISATGIRQRLAGGRAVGDLLPPAVLAYIHSHHLYHWQADDSEEA